MNPEDETGQELAKINAILRVKFGVEPETLTNEQYAQLFQEWAYVQKVESKTQENAFRKVMQEVLMAVFSTSEND